MGTANPLQQINQYGQSIWIDFIQRSMLDSGDLQAMIDADGIKGLTSNPSIFEQAIAKTSEYDQSIQAAGDVDALSVFQHLAIEDIQRAADIFRPVYEASRGDDGMVSLEVSPKLAHDAEATVTEALALHQRLQRPNVMIKVPGTEAGVEAFEILTRHGINVNVTLLFSVPRYRAIGDAYVRALEARMAAGEAVSGIASVASFFISRVDSAVDQALAELAQPEAKALQSQIAVANAKAAYQYYHGLFNGPRFAALRAQGALPQRLLWASTSTKNPELSDVYYLEALIGEDTVNTVPPATLEAFRDHGQAANRLTEETESALEQLAQLAQLGVDLEAITEQLERDGVSSFDQAFERMLEAIAQKQAR